MATSKKASSGKSTAQSGAPGRAGRVETGAGAAEGRAAERGAGRHCRSGAAAAHGDHQEALGLHQSPRPAGRPGQTPDQRGSHADTDFWRENVRLDVRAGQAGEPTRAVRGHLSTREQSHTNEHHPGPDTRLQSSAVQQKSIRLTYAWTFRRGNKHVSLEPTLRVRRTPEQRRGGKADHGGLSGRPTRRWTTGSPCERGTRHPESSPDGHGRQQACGDARRVRWRQALHAGDLSQ
jgi:hypothetical protein